MSTSEQPMHISSCLWAKAGTAQPLQVPPSCIFCSFYPLVFFSRAPAARRPDPGGQWRFPNWGYQREVPYPDGNLAFLSVLYNSVKWFGPQVEQRTLGRCFVCALVQTKGFCTQHCLQGPTWKLLMKLSMRSFSLKTEQRTHLHV